MSHNPYFPKEVKMDHEKLKKLSEEELLELIGIDLFNLKKEALPSKRKYIIDVAKRWIESKKSALQNEICKSTTVRENLDSDIMVLTAAIADLIASICFGVSPLTVAYLLVKMGIEKLCYTIWNE